MMSARPAAPANRLVVVGAGVTGLTVAWEWRRTHPDDEVVVLEAGDRIGGKLDRVRLAGQWYDTGPEAMLARVPEALELVEALGLAGRLVAPATTQASVVLPDGRHRLPAGTVLGVPASAGDLEGLLSADGVARVRAEAARRVGPGRSLQGNLDPAVLLADRATVDREVRRVVEQGRAARGHVFNLGHGVLPDTDPGVLTHVVELVHELTGR